LAQDRNSLQDKQWTPTGAGPMVPEEEEDCIGIDLATMKGCRAELT